MRPKGNPMGETKSVPHAQAGPAPDAARRGPARPRGRERHPTREPHLTIEEIAGDLQVSTRTVRRWIGDGTLAHRRLGRLVRVPVAEYRDFLARRRGS